MVKSNPESASNLAIVAAVASSNSDSGTVTTGQVTTLAQEREVLPIDYLKVLAGPVLTSATAVGISAITNETTRASINANKSVRLAEVGVDNSIIGAINNAIDELDDDELSNQSASTTTANDTSVTVVDADVDTTVVDDSTVVDVVADTNDDVVADVVDTTTEVDDTTDSTSYYNDTECAAGLELVQTNWGSQCQ